ncbi:MAG: T9SS type A sorting domain-containing protein [candidate division WOR-3 bacterium]
MGKVLLFFLPIFFSAQICRFKKIGGSFPIGHFWLPTLLFDSNRDGGLDLTFNLQSREWQIWEYGFQNQFQLNYRNIGNRTGKWDIGDVDQDGLIDRLESGLDSLGEGMLVLTCESPNSSSYPTEINWVYHVMGEEMTSWYSYYPGDLDGDGRREILYNTTGQGVIFIMENRGNNDNRLVWSSDVRSILTTGGAIAFGDFDQDGRMEFALSGISWRNWVKVFENISDDQYQLVFTDSIPLPNGHFDAFSGNDVNQNGKPEFFINFIELIGWPQFWNFHLYMWEAIGNNRYQRSYIGSTFGCFRVGIVKSRCADVDGDGVEEIIQSAGSQIKIYKFLNGEFRTLFEYQFGNFSAWINCADLNSNHYQEIIISGGDPIPQTDIIEIEGVRIKRPNRGERFIPGTCELIQWWLFYPPRCDSLSLFYSIDNGRSYYPIITSLSGTETTYHWTVPNTPSESCRVKIIAYGAGWLADESDGVFKITGEIEKMGRSQLKDRLIIYPNPVSDYFFIHLPAVAEEIRIYDASGKLVRGCSIQPQDRETKFVVKDLKPGVYFLRVKIKEGCFTKKLILW